MTVKVTAGEARLKSVSLGKGLVAGGDAGKLTSSPTGLGGFALAPGKSRSFSYKLKALKVGTVALTASASATSATGKAAHGSGKDAVRVGKQALAISIVSTAENTTASKFPLDVDDKGHVSPKNLTVKVKFTNTGKTTMNGVELLSLRPVPVDLTQELDQLAFPQDCGAGHVGHLQARGDRHAAVHPEGDGRREVPDSGPGPVLRAVGGERRRLCECRRRGVRGDRAAALLHRHARRTTT